LPPSQSAGKRPERRRNDRDVPAGDRDDVARAADREGVREVAVDAVSEADEDAGGQAGLGLGHGSIEAFRRRPPNPLHRLIDGACWRQQVERIGPQRADRADLCQIRTVVIRRRRPDAARDGDAIARYHLRIPGQRRGDSRRFVSVDVEQERSGTGAAYPCPDGSS
jgi:hypothetical protein